MVQLVELECKNCGGQLNRITEDMAKCPHCGAEYIIDDGVTQQTTYVFKETPKDDGNPMIALAILAPILLLLIFAIVTVANQGGGSHTSKVQENVENTIKETGLCSELFQTFVKEIYQISYDKVTAEQMRAVTHFDLYWSNGCNVVEYALSDGEVHKLELDASLSVSTADLNYFTGLKSLYIQGYGLSKGDIDDLLQLTEIGAGNSPAELAEIIPKPENIREMECYRVEALTGVDVFTSLERLYLSDNDLTDITALGALTSLKELTIENGDKIADFGVLYSLSDLEYLLIQSELLKDISFVKDMKKLQDLTIKDSIVIDVSALEDLTSLTRLELTNNSEIQDFASLSSLVALDTLVLDLGSVDSMPSVEQWQELTSLSVRGAEDIGFLESLPNLINLTLSGCNCTKDEVFGELQKLQSLRINGMYGELEDLKVLTNMQELRILDINSMTLYGNVEYLFGIPNLEELNFNDCSFELDFANIPDNGNLKRLYMNQLSLWTNIQVQYEGAFTYLDYDTVAMEDNISFLNHFPNLEELYVRGNKLTNVEFATSLKKLKKMDISDNYITDLRPLGTLTELEIVWCQGNAIAQGNSLGGEVLIIDGDDNSH